MINHFECHGKWKRIEDQNWLEGTLTFDQKEGANLSLLGAFPREGITFLSDNPRIVIGKTSIGDCTLIDVRHRRTQSNNRSEITTSRYEPTVILHGVHFEDEKDITFRSVLFRGFNLLQWLDPNTINVSQDILKGEMTLSSKPKEKIKFNYKNDFNAEISFETNIESNKNDEYFSMTPKCRVKYEYTDSMNWRHILEDISKFLSFVSFCCNEQSYPLEIIFQDPKFQFEVNQQEYPININCYYSNTTYSASHKLRQPHEHILSFNKVSERIETVLPMWFDYYEKIKPVLNLLLYGLQTKRVFRVEKFIDAVRAVEVFHRRTKKSNRMNQLDYDQFKGRMLSFPTQTKIEKEWIQGALRYGNEPSLRLRLKELIKYYPCAPLFRNKKERDSFCSKVVTNRNYYTHYDESLKDSLVDMPHLSKITKQLRALLYICLLTDFGVEQEQYIDTVRYYFIDL